MRNDAGQRSPRQHGRVRIAEITHNILYSAEILHCLINVFAVQAQSPAWPVGRMRRLPDNRHARQPGQAVALLEYP
jgi:hypothetical protein